ncbi:nucleoside-diphosphate kinase [Halorarum salinum]|uniref:nucleoside-diphosphate kinase n=1 Tax=Halorarum salinum TaxID=2743089 RepID=UPI001C53091C|nr:nucleoside-diphosphate kinase [Halobaculum salinum]
MEETLVLVKPDAVDRNLVGDVLHRFEAAGLSIAALELQHPSTTLVEEHYEEHRGKDFYPGLVAFLAENPVVAAILQGENAVTTARTIAGETEPVNAEDGTIRGDLGQDTLEQADAENRALYNLVHTADSPQAAQREITMWFPDNA